jgi:arsenate reductase
MLNYNPNKSTYFISPPVSVMDRILFLLILGFVMSGVEHDVAAAQLFPQVAQYVQERIAEFEQIPQSRRLELEQLSSYIRQTAGQDGITRLTFVCTHNSRRSQLAQIWTSVAAAHYIIPAVETFSGGTEVTAFNDRCIEALRRCGLEITAGGADTENPRYQVEFQDGRIAELCFSKIYDSAPNPVSHFCAVMTCSQADEACPLVSGCDLRISITYEDPKIADDTAWEQDLYDERSRQIAREMLYMMSRVAE